MRQRKPKNLEQRLAATACLTIEEPERLRGAWLEKLAESAPRLYLEIGCGKGQFITDLAQEHPENLYIAAEGQESVLIHALEKAKDAGLKNVFFINAFISAIESRKDKDLREIFAPGELDGIFLNFSDPWPKDRHAKRRLTHAGYLAAYEDVLKLGGGIEFRTDNATLFEFSRAEIADRDNLTIVENFPETDSVISEYEEKFRRWKRRIYRICAISIKH